MSMDEERLLNLQMVADKKISASEAAELLKALDGPYHHSTIEKGRIDEIVREAERTAREAAHTIAVNAKQLARDAREATRREGNIGTLIGRIFENFTFDIGDERFSFEDVVTGEFSAETPRLRLQTHNGKLHLHAWDEPTYKIALQYKVKGVNSEPEARAVVAERIQVEATPEGITLGGKEGGFLQERGVSVNVEIWVPRDRKYQLEGRTGNGSLKLAGLVLTDGNLNSGNGSIKVEEVTAHTLKTTTGNGSITVEGNLGEYKGQTGNGSLRVRPTGPGKQQIHVSTGNGSAHIDMSGLAETAGFRVDATTGMGGIHVHLSDVVMEKSVKAIGNKHVILHSRNYHDVADKVDVKANTGLGSITVE